jgi:omega-6 fatty acid desaturase (delta-12 desaturase)
LRATSSSLHNNNSSPTPQPPPCFLPSQALAPRRAAVAGLRRPAVLLRAAAVDVNTTSTAPAQESDYPPYSRDTVGQLPLEERQKLAEQWGYQKIGAELPAGVTLNQVVRSMPEEVFELNPWKAWGAVLLSITSMAASLYLISVAPWYLLPLAWFVAGTAFTGFFVVGHDCGHRSFSSNKLLEDIVGTFMFAPLIYPFEPWRIKHNQHHAQTNKLVEDTAWHPIMEDEMAKWNGTQRFLYKAFLGTPLKLWASVGHWWVWHFDLSKYTEKQRPRVLVSLAACALFAATAFPALFAYGGVAAWAKFWLMPWLGYHFWMSTFTLVHHTAPHIPFKPAEQWDAAKAQLSGTVDCDFPKWIEILTHDISVHVPHHVSSKIPWYNLRKANASLWSNWGEHMTKAKFNPRLLRTVCAELHVHEKGTGLYRPFDAEKPELMFEMQRKLIPNVM